MSDRAALTIPDEVAELEPFAAAGVFDTTDLHFAAAISHFIGRRGKDRGHVLLAAALAARAPRFGHVCMNLADPKSSIAADIPDRSALDDLHWPKGESLVNAVSGRYAKVVVEQAAAMELDDNEMFQRPLVLRGDLLYLQRYERYERSVLGDIRARAAAPPESLSADSRELLSALFPESGLQRDAAARAISRPFTVLAGGPGTGKTYTLARILAALRTVAVRSGTELAIALAAPTGKAASRMTEAISSAVADLELPPEVHDQMAGDSAVTIHRLLGRADGVRFQHDHTNRLHHDVLVVDEASMISLPLMARLLDAIGPGARVILVGDPFQLASVEAGAVFGEIAADAVNEGGTVAESIVRLRRTHRFDERSGVGQLADAIKLGDGARALDLLRDPDVADLSLVDPQDAAAVQAVRDVLVGIGRRVIEAAEGTDPARGGSADQAMALASQAKVLCGIRHGSLGVDAWQQRLERDILADRATRGSQGRWYIGRPVMMTRNDYLLSLFNGDTGVVIAGPGGSRRVHFPWAENPESLDPSQIGDIDTWWAMTIHKSQGSEFEHVVLSLPEASSPALTRELLYTGVTRAKSEITVVASEVAVREAIHRPVRRVSGLRSALWA